MSLVRVETHIKAPIEKVFDLWRDVDIHVKSVAWTKEQAIAGRTTGKLELGDFVTWEANHLGVRQQLTSKIVEMKRPHVLSDEMQRGAFKRLYHKRIFSVRDGGTLIADTLDFEAPLGIVGKLFDVLILKKYMRNFLLRRNAYVKQLAESLSVDTS